jgi:biopolymer transport protein ExbD
MDLIPEEELSQKGGVNLAPMVDFLFLVLAVFATMAITRAALFDHEIELVKVKTEREGYTAPGYNEHVIVNIGVTADGKYKWITEVNEFLVGSTQGLQKELQREQELGLLPRDASQVKVLLHIDREAHWEAIAQAIFAVKEAGFEIHPVYEPVDLP